MSPGNSPHERLYRMANEDKHETTGTDNADAFVAGCMMQFVDDPEMEIWSPEEAGLVYWDGECYMTIPCQYWDGEQFVDGVPDEPATPAKSPPSLLAIFIGAFIVAYVLLMAVTMATYVYRAFAG